MPRLPYRRARGAIHDYQTMASLGQDAIFLACLSARSLYILENLAALDITFLSRYALDFDALTETYAPVSDDADAEAATTIAISELQLELQEASMIDLTAVIASLNGIRLAIENANFGAGCGCDDGTDIDSPGADGPPPIGFDPGDQFETEVKYLEYKCRAANLIWETIDGILSGLEDSPVEELLALGVGVATAAVVSILASTPLGWGVVLILGIISGIITLIATTSIDLSSMLSNWSDNREGIVCALYTSATTTQAGDNVLAVVSLASAEEALLSLLLTNTLLDNLFNKDDRAVSADDPVDPIDCDLCAVQGECDDGDILCDLLTGTSQVDLAGHTPDVLIATGNPWVEVASSWEINDNEAAPSPSGNNRMLAVIDTEVGDNYTLACRMYHDVSGQGGVNGLIIRCSSDRERMYIFGLAPDSGSSGFYTYNSDTPLFSALETRVIDAPLEQYYTLVVTVSGTTITGSVLELDEDYEVVSSLFSGDLVGMMSPSNNARFDWIRQF